MPRPIPIAMLAFALLVSAAPAAETPTRDEYVERLEAICKPDNEATQRAMKGARADVRAERLAVAAGKFARASEIFAGTVREMKPVPRPGADQAKLRRWFGYLGDQEGYLDGVTAELRAGHAVKAQRLIARFIHSGNLANSVILPFGFDSCEFKFSRYG